MKYPAYPQYKDSGVQWLGEVPGHWEVKRIKHIGSIRYGLGEPPEYDHQGLPFIRATDINRGKIDLSAVKMVSPDAVPWSRRPSLEIDEILIVRSGAYTGDSAIVTEEIAGCIAGYDMVLTVTSAMPQFVAWVMLSKYMLESQIYIARLRAAQPHLNAEELCGFLILTPPFPEQTAIADFLDRETGRIDTLVEKKRRLIALLGEKRTALISRTVTRGLPAEAAHEFGLEPHTGFKDSGIEWLGEVPEGWEVKRIKQILQTKKGAIKTGPFGSQLQSAEMLESDIKVYNQRSVIDRDFSAGENYISLHKFIELRAFEVFSGDLLVTTRGTIGRCAILPKSAEQGILHPCLMRLQLNHQCSGRFVEILIQESGKVLEQLRLMSNATTIEVIYSESLKEVWLALPPLPEQTAIAAYLDRETATIDQLVAKVEAAIVRLLEYRTALITAAVTGKIDVRGKADKQGPTRTDRTDPN